LRSAFPSASRPSAVRRESRDLQSPLSDLRAGKIDVVVVYKVDRLTRSLADFAKLVELFEQQLVGGPVPLGYRCIDKKVVVVPEEADAVRSIFERYRVLGSIGALIEDLDRRRIRTKQRRGINGQVMGSIRFGVGALAYLLKNRFYIGDRVSRRNPFRRARTDPRP
jgi:site-specific DNA recombinase